MKARELGLATRLLKWVYKAYLNLWYMGTSRKAFGQNIYDREWDVLLVLDACRTDALRAVAPEYDFIERVDSVTSVGSHSQEWLANTFTTDYREEIAGTVLLTGNTHAELVFEERDYPPRKGWESGLAWFDWDPVGADAFERLDFAWKGGYDPELGIVPPRYLTDQAIAAARSSDPGRLVVHYMQPHDPFIHGAVTEGRPLSAFERNPIESFNSGEVTREEVWDAYLDNLRLVLDDIELLLANVDADRVVLTADHGEGLGEMGITGHPGGVPHPVLRRVPWVETTATDRGTHDPDLERRGSTSTEEHLRQLGYIS